MKKALLLRSLIWLSAAGLSPILRAAEPAPAPVESTITLPKFEVNGRAICSYGIGILFVLDKTNRNVNRLFVDEVASGSVGEDLGLHKGDEILSLNGIKIADLKGGLKPAGDLFSLLVNQPVGRKIKIEVAVRVVKQVTLTATP